MATQREAPCLESVPVDNIDRPCAPSILPRLISGSIGSLVTALAVTPAEVVKVRQQAGLTPTTAPSSLPTYVKPCPAGCGTFIFNNGLMDCILPKSAVKYFDQDGKLTEQARRLTLETRSNQQPIGTFAMMRRIFMNEGFGGLYAGLRPTLYMSVPNTVMYYAAYDEIVARLRQQHALIHDDAHRNAPSDWWIPMVSGSSARMLASSLTAPLELVRTRQAALVGASGKAPGMLEEFRIMVRTEGVGGLYQGLAPTLWRDIPFSGIYWVCLEQFKLCWKQYDDANHVPSPSDASVPLQTAWRSFLNGATAGMIAAAATTPFDVIKTKRQTAIDVVTTVATEEIACDHHGAVAYKQSSANTSMSALSRRNEGTLTMMRRILETEGVRGLWRGNQTRMIKVAPACAIMITCYEVGKKVMME